MKIHRVKQKAMIVARRLLNQTGMKKKKVFAVGFNKSGTMSLHVLFESLGLPSYHGEQWRGCDDIKLLHSYDCFSDGIPKDLAKLDRMFPDSKFILQVRELDSWVYSRLAHIEQGKKIDTNTGDRYWDNTEYAIKTWIKQRNAHHLFVLSYFAGRPSDILVVNVTRNKSAATKICNFLGYEGEYETPKVNANPSKEHPLKNTEMLSKCIAELEIPERELKYDIYCPSIVSSEAHVRFPADSSMLEITKGYTKSSR